MLKKVLTGLAVGMVVIAASAVAQAEININIYGASAQHLYWNDYAEDFLKTAKSCSNVSADEFDSKHGITRGTCGGETVYIRYSSKASYDAVYALRGIFPDPPQGCTTGFERQMVNETTCPGTWVKGDTNKCTALKCVKVNVGAMDVVGSSFTQTTAGHTYGNTKTTGPDGVGVPTNPWMKRSFTSTSVNDSGLNRQSPIVVPFGFFAHNSVTKTKCLGPDPKEPTASAHKAISTWGNQCWDPDGDGKSKDCIGSYKCISGTCSGGERSGQACSTPAQCPDVALEGTNCQRMPLDNVSRLMVAMIFSGQALNWQDFGAWYPALDVVGCMRHAGSGTQATFDWAIMRDSSKRWYGDIPEVERFQDSKLWFLEGSSDMMKCIDINPGAIGFADADQLEAGTTNYPNVHALKYNGIEPRRPKIRNGEYEFYSNINMYTAGDTSIPNFITNWYNSLWQFAQEPENLQDLKAKYWATKKEMAFNKTSDRDMPGYVEALEPQEP
jgi:hypothetical protein